MSRAQGVLGAARAPEAFLSPMRIFSLLLPAGSLCFAILLGLPGAIYAPDALHYRLLALGQRNGVPAPFSARILGPAMAGWLGRVSGLGVDTGFLLLGIVCLVALLALIAGLLWSWRAPIAIFAGIFLMPFWIDIFHDYYLPDLLHAAILAAILLCLLFGHTSLALLLLFPAYLARESTVLVALCLVFATWRRIPVRPAVIGVLAMLGGGLVSRYYAQAGPASVHGLTGGSYILGKLVWNLFRNVIGVPLWSNTLPECSPIWVAALPHGYHLGAVRLIGLCPPSLWGPARTVLSWFGIFGIGPALALALWRRLVSPAALSGRLWRRPIFSAEQEPPVSALASTEQIHGLGGEPRFSTGFVIVFRFCFVYGVISLALAPLLGASVDRLVDYGWPFYFVLLPWFIVASRTLPGRRSACILLLHLLTCWMAWLGFWHHGVGDLSAALAVLVLNGLGYALVRRYYSVSSMNPPW
jgi:hypothetical protein